MPDPLTVQDVDGDEAPPLATFLRQEIGHYNLLHSTLKSTCRDLTRSIQGLLVMSPDLESTADALHDGKVRDASLTEKGAVSYYYYNRYSRDAVR